MSALVLQACRATQRSVKPSGIVREPRGNGGNPSGNPPFHLGDGLPPLGVGGFPQKCWPHLQIPRIHTFKQGIPHQPLLADKKGNYIMKMAVAALVKARLTFCRGGFTRPNR